MAEEAIGLQVENGEITLEGLMEEGRIGRNAIICHPHPLFGGNMQNNVVEVVRQTFASLGWGTLRFNFRGTGASGGNPEEGQKHALDLITISEFIRTRSAGRIDFAAYSYGAWATMAAVQMGLCPDSLILISPPLDFISFEGLKLPDTPTLIIAGDQDDYCSLQSLKNWLSNSPDSMLASLESLAGVDHFYWGAERELSAKMVTFLETRILKVQIH
jgi:hypothetical protein